MIVIEVISISLWVHIHERVVEAILHVSWVSIGVLSVVNVPLHRVGRPADDYSLVDDFLPDLPHLILDRLQGIDRKCGPGVRSLHWTNMLTHVAPLLMSVHERPFQAVQDIFDLYGETH